MDSYEADRFMRDHSSMAVRRDAGGNWIAWDLFASKYPFNENLVYGSTRERAIENYRDKYHPEKPPLGNSNVVKKHLRDSAKYRNAAIETKSELVKRLDELIEAREKIVELQTQLLDTKDTP